MKLAAAGLMPMSPVIAEEGTLEMAVFARTAKFPAVPSPTRAGPSAAVLPVTKFQEKGAAMALPCRSLTPAPMVAV